MTSRRHCYKGYECTATWHPEHQLWLCEVTNASIPFGFESSSEETIDGNLEREVEAYISRCEQKGIEPRKSLLSAARGDPSADFVRNTRKRLQREARQARIEEQKFKNSPWYYIAFGTLAIIPMMGWLALSTFNRIVPFTMFFPYKADIKTKRLALITPLVMLVCIGVFIAQSYSQNRFEKQCVGYFGYNADMYPAERYLNSYGFGYSDGCYLLSYLSMYEYEERMVIYQWLVNLITEDYEEYGKPEWVEWPTVEEFSGILEAALPLYEAHVDNSLTSELMYYPNSYDFLGVYTSVFAHADLWHITFNLIFFFAFAVSVELLAGPLFVLVCFLIGPVFGAILYSDQAFLESITSADYIPHAVLGLSGMCTLFMAALLVLMPKLNIRCFFWFVLYLKKFTVPVYFLAAWYVGFDILALIDGENDGVSYISHLAGALFGALAAFTYKYVLNGKLQLEKLEDAEPA